MAAHPFSELAGEGPDEADQAVAAELTDFGNAIVQHDVDQVRAIDAALRRIRERTFGSCVDCHGAIPLERLVASPTAIRCIECQTRYEHTHYQRVSYTL